MSGGERRRVALAQLLVSAPELAILDEPTNHLDVETIEWLEHELKTRYPGALLLITHDRYVLDRVVTRTFEIDRGAVHDYEGGWSEYLRRKAERMALAERTEHNRQKFVAQELEWLRRSPKARTSKQKARIGRAETAISQKGPSRDRTTRLEMDTTRLGKRIVDLEDVVVEIAGRTLVDGLDLTLTRGERIGIIGKNGTGKTSLLRVLLGDLEPVRGKVVRGKNTRFAYFDQRRGGLVDEETILENVSGKKDKVELRGRTLDVRSYMQRFLFAPERLREKVGALSGGERARVVLAKLLLQPANVLLFDEPTNDLDVATLGALEELLLDMNATALVVSHDRYFLDRIATSILAFEGDGRVVRYVGDYDTYRRLRREKEVEAKPEKSKPKPKPKPKSALSYKEKKELEGLPAHIEEVEAELAEIDATLADPATYAERGDEIPELQKKRAEVSTRIEELMARWEELEERLAD